MTRFEESNAPNGPAELLIVAHTHWDREWYRPFEAYRYRLVKTVDTVLGSDLPHFVLDGQTALLEDYLAVRPDRRDELAAGIANGRLGFGPWFVLVDEFLVSGEALIRNLLLGRSAMRAFGVPDPASAVGYLPDMFGHLAQMPQILAGFGITRTVLWRGARPDAPAFWWIGPDGTQLAAAWLPRGYYQTPLIEDLTLEQRAAQLSSYVKAFEPHSNAWLLAGADHMAPRNDTFKLIQQLQTLALPFTLRVGRLEDIFENFATEATLHGELREPLGLAYILPGVLSARTYLKQANSRAQLLLERYAEPLVALAWWGGASGDDPHRGLQLAWKTLLLNHPHDSICGCSVDQVHREMLPRFAACHQIAEEALSEAVQQFKRPVPHPDVFVFNPAPVAFEGWVDLQVVWAQHESAAAPDTLSFETGEGQALPAVVWDVREQAQFHADLDVLPDWYPAKVYQASIWLRLPPSGGQRLRAREGDPLAPASPQLHVLSSDEALENASLRLTVRGGSLHLTDKRTGIEYSDIHRFCDQADAGDTYNFSPLANDPVLNLPIVRHGLLPATHPLKRTLEVVYSLSVPVALDKERTQRSAETAPLEIVARFTLGSDSGAIDVETVIEHHHRDHRLRLLTGGVSADAEFWTESAFGLFPRRAPDVSPLPVAKGHEAIMPEVPTGVCSLLREPNGRGLAIASEGLHEVSVVRDLARTDVAITLLRAVGWLSRDDLRTRGGGAGPRFETPEAQCPGTLRFRYALIPVADPERDLLSGTWTWMAPPRAWCGDGPGVEGPLASWEAPQVVASACKRSESGTDVVVRAYNSGNEAVTTRMHIHAPDARWAPASLAEEPLGDFCQTSTSEVHFRPYEIKTWLLRKRDAKA